MPVYNPKEEEFRVAIESILNQTFIDFEFLIINDDSPNNVKDIVKSYNDSRIIYGKNTENLGIIETLNEGLEISKGKYIARIDQDDYSYPTRLEKQYKYMEENPNVGALGTLVKDRNFIPTDSNDLIFLQRYVHGCIMHSSVMIRKSVLDENKLRYNRNCEYAEDFKLWSDISRVSDIAIYPEVLTIYRISKDGMSKTHSKEQSRIVRFLKLDNMILDFKCDKLYLQGILKKKINSEPVTQEENKDMRNFILSVRKFLMNEVSDQFKDNIEIFTNLLISMFNE